jgi:hypothetical protein
MAFRIGGFSMRVKLQYKIAISLKSNQKCGNASMRQKRKRQRLKEVSDY